jgi:hypothetical protein
VTRLLPGITTVWIELEDGTRVTPEHPYLTSNGTFKAIAEILHDGDLVIDVAGNARCLSGRFLKATDAGADATWIDPDPVSVGGTLVRPAPILGWRTYNFTVEGLHTYIAGGLRVHNQCWWPGDSSTNVTMGIDGVLLVEGQDAGGAAFEVRQWFDPSIGGWIAERFDGTGDLFSRSQVTEGGESTTWFGASPIAQAMAGPLALGPFASWGDYFESRGTDPTDLSTFTEWRTIGDETPGVINVGATINATNGWRAEVRVERPDPFGEVVVWEHTEYSPAGEVISYSYGTTLRATGQPVIVTWERDTDSNGEPTGTWQPSYEKYDPNQPEPDDLTAAQIGEIFGSQLGSLIAGSNPFAQVLAGSALATVLGNIGGAISWFNSDNDAGDGPPSLTDDLSDIEVPEFSNFFTVLKGQASGALSSFLAAELGEALGVEGFGGQLFTIVASRTIGHVLDTVVRNPIAPPKTGGIFTGQATAYRRRPCSALSTRSARCRASGSAKTRAMGRAREAAARSARTPPAPSRRARSFSVLTSRAPCA